MKRQGDFRPPSDLDPREVGAASALKRSERNHLAPTDGRLSQFEVVDTERRFFAVVGNCVSTRSLITTLETLRIERSAQSSFAEQRTDAAGFGWHMMLGSLVTIVICCFFAIFYMLGLQARGHAGNTQTYYFEVGGPGDRRGGGTDARSDAVQKPRLPRTNAEIARSQPLSTKQPIGRQVAALAPVLAAPSTQANAQGSSAQPPVEPTLIVEEAVVAPQENIVFNRAAATKEAFKTGRIQEWSEDGLNGYVLADPPQEGSGSPCRTMILWRTGAAQGDVQKSTVCS